MTAKELIQELQQLDQPEENLDNESVVIWFIS